MVYNPMSQQPVEQEQAIMVGVNVKGSRPLLSLEDSLTELKLLADTAGIAVKGAVTQNVGKIDPATFIGSGKVEEVKETLLASGAKTVLFDDELSPRHQRELEEVFGEEVKVLDRSALILDIFAQHAKTREGALQVELAQYEYRLPRLTRMWTHLARQAGGAGGRSGSGGVGLRGPGETQLEVDRRDIRRRISKLKEDLEHVREHRSRHRSQRERTGVPLVALVGYTNAGKSTLLRALTGADVYIANQLFATLDPTTRRVDLPSGRQALITDTVGFIQKLPTTLIAAFQATLEEIRDADIILEVADVNHPNVLQHLESVEDTLAEIEVPPVPRILVWNKIDQWKGGMEALPKPENAADYVAQVTVSATENTGMDRLLGAVETALKAVLHRAKLLIPYERGDLVSLLHESASVEKQQHTQEGVLLTVKLPHDLHERFKEYRV
jgi:GTP-binding protein HflX